ncbi:MAG TPA: hypothetical protein VJJ46_08140 [Anaerolineales bacterium]|nr:hypothetical protein [Anaerolineales bacterium]
MTPEFPENVLAIMALLGYLIRPLGVLVFGVAVGWLTIRVLKMEGEGWQLRLAAFLGLLAAFVLLGHWVSGGGTLGMFGLGAGAALLFWGVLADRRAARGED